MKTKFQKISLFSRISNTISDSRSKRKAKTVERLRTECAELREQQNNAQTDDQKILLGKKIEAVENKIEILRVGSYYYKRQKKEERQKRAEERKQQRQSKRVDRLDEKINRIKSGNASHADKKIAHLEAKKRRVQLGRAGLRLARSKQVEEKLEELRVTISETEQTLFYEKTQGTAEEKEIQKIERTLEKQKQKEIRLREKIRVLQQTHFITIRCRKSLFGIAFVSPWIIGFLLLFVYPFVQTLRLSMGEITDTLNYTIEFTGFSQYTKILFEEPDVLLMLVDVLKNSFINMILITIFAFYIAMLLNRNMRFRGVFRVLCFLPVMLGSGFIMKQLLAQDITTSSMQSVIDFILPKEIVIYIGPKVQNAVVFFLSRLTEILWHSGVQILLFLSGLQSISASLYEAARIDGATEWESLWFITVPMMTPMILLNLVFTIVETFNDSNNEIIARIQTYAFSYSQFSYSAAMGMFFALFALLLVGMVFLIMRPFIKDVKS